MFTKEELFVIEAALRARKHRLYEHGNFILKEGKPAEIRWYQESLEETEALLKKVTEAL